MYSMKIIWQIIQLESICQLYGTEQWPNMWKDVVIKLMFVPNVMTVATYCLGKSINFLCFLMKYKSFQGKILYKIYTT